MSRIFFIFFTGLGGVFLSMALLYGAVRFNALVADLIEGGREAADNHDGSGHKKKTGKERGK